MAQTDSQTHLDAQEKKWTAPKLILLLLITLSIAFACILTAAHWSGE